MNATERKRKQRSSLLYRIKERNHEKYLRQPEKLGGGMELLSRLNIIIVNGEQRIEGAVHLEKFMGKRK
jgi:hypothetical protein